MTPYYEQDGITIYHRRCEDVLPSLHDIDLIFTSPPYNLGVSSGGGFPGEPPVVMGHYAADAPLGKKRGGAGKWSGGALAGGYGEYDDAMPHNVYVGWQNAVLLQCWKTLSERGVIFYNHKPRILNGRLISPLDYVPSDLSANVRQIVIWARAGGVNFSPAFYLPTHEWIVILAKSAFRLKSKGASGIGDVWTVPQESFTPHPAPFPVGLPARAMETTPMGTVLDPCRRIEQHAARTVSVRG
ncbi:MAG: site-specific DNA-methyltransferase [Thermomicrobia bacterium]|nr:site-specific DNA-methyltransferase [Thermomicrobia bacterium]